MIARLVGIVESAGETGCVIDVGGVGYSVFCSARTLRALPRPGESARLLIETHVREDHIHLYGFVSEAERYWFVTLQTVQGVGPRLALGILSTLSPQDLAQAVAANDRAALAQGPGVGAKLAARLATELKDKVAEWIGPAAGPGGAPADGDGPLIEDAVSALVNLGYRRGEALGAVRLAGKDVGGKGDLGKLIRAGLKELAR